MAAVLAVAAFSWTHGWFSDFATFYRSASAWPSPAVYGTPANFNPPHAIWLMRPLTAASLRPAWVVWQAANLAAVAAAIALLRGGARRRWSKLPLVLLTAPLGAQVLHGQVVGFLLVPIVLSWRAVVTRRIALGGAWFGLAIACKPFLAAACLPALWDRRWRPFAATALVAGVLPWGVGLAAWGPELYRVYLAQAATGVRYAGIGITNTSPAAWLIRAGVPGTLATVMVLAPGLAMLWHRWPRASCHRQWQLALISTLVVTPLAWVQYLLWLLPVVWMMNRWTRLRRLACGVLCVPPIVALAYPDTKGVYGLALLLLYVDAAYPSLGRRQIARSVDVAHATGSSLGPAPAADSGPREEAPSRTPSAQL